MTNEPKNKTWSRQLRGAFAVSSLALMTGCATYKPYYEPPVHPEPRQVGGVVFTGPTPTVVVPPQAPTVIALPPTVVVPAPVIIAPRPEYR